MTVTVALPVTVARQPFESVADVTEYVVVVDGLTVKFKGLDPVCTPPPLSKVTVYGGAPPVRVTVTMAESPAQIVPPPLTKPVMLGHGQGVRVNVKGDVQ